MFAHVDSLVVRGDVDALDAAGDLAGVLLLIGQEDQAIILPGRVVESRASRFEANHVGVVRDRLRHATLLLDAEHPERLVELYEAWHEHEPEAGHDERLASWQEWIEESHFNR